MTDKVLVNDLLTFDKVILDSGYFNFGSFVRITEWITWCFLLDSAVLLLVWTPGLFSRCAFAVQRALWGGFTRARLSGWCWSLIYLPPGAPSSASNRLHLSAEPVCSLNGPGSWSCWWQTASVMSRCSVSGQMGLRDQLSTSRPARREMEPGAGARWASDMNCWATEASHPTWATTGCRVSTHL